LYLNLLLKQLFSSRLRRLPITGSLKDTRWHGDDVVDAADNCLLYLKVSITVVSNCHCNLETGYALTLTSVLYFCIHCVSEKTSPLLCQW